MMEDMDIQVALDAIDKLKEVLAKSRMDKFGSKPEETEAVEDSMEEAADMKAPSAEGLMDEESMEGEDPKEELKKYLLSGPKKPARRPGTALMIGVEKKVTAKPFSKKGK